MTRSVYDQDGYLGSRYNFDDTPLGAFDTDSTQGAMKLTRDGDEFVFSGTLDFTPGDDDQVNEGDDTSNITVAVTFPGAVTDSNGDVSGTTVRWSTTVEARVDMEARGSAIASGPPVWVWILVGLAVLLAAVVVAVVLIMRSRRDRSAL